MGQGLEQTYLYLWYTLFQWNIFDQRQLSTVSISDNIRLSTLQYTISDDYLQYTIIYNIRLSTVYEYLWYAISGNIILSTIYNRRKNTFINNIQSVTLYDYLQHTENGQQ